ncbi:S41 family peptidase [Pelagibacterium sp. 26DY04]|uniref:S41 family peptidase n=1 Tax=Pelagibacterium sp. 26DY04 TaxID=2967130 RepID=UPI00281637D4|nr:S41 family peptidase [Pelagibacterium sp. 26DY04]WMT86838.1 S41 family peptidase [Pelagibacterium sp. 26DY04]
MAVVFKRALIALMAVLVSVGPIAAQTEQGEMTQQEQDEFYRQLELFGLVLDRIRDEYIEAPDETELIRAAIQGMLTSLDPHSAYLSPESFADVREDTSGTFGGLGIEVTMEEGLVKVVTPYDESPASRAGILANDFVVEIDGQQVMGMTLDEAVELMRGEIGTDVDVVIAREGVDQPIELTLTRDIIEVSAVRWSMERDVPVIRLSRFSGQAFSGLDEAIREIFAENDGEAPTGIILDLRNNPGGLVDQAQFVADAFLSQGSVVLTRGRIDSQNSRYDARPDELDAMLADVPVIVLINGGSASAAEIVAGALQDQGRATLVGTRSFGKGSVQSIIPLGFDGAMRLTTARYYTPNNRSIQALGITPDIEVLQDVPEELQGFDTIIGEAGLAGHIAGEEEEATVGSSVYVPADKAEDNQLQHAIDLILGETEDPAFPPNPDAVVAQQDTEAAEAEAETTETE